MIIKEIIQWVNSPNGDDVHRIFLLSGVVGRSAWHISIWIVLCVAIHGSNAMNICNILKLSVYSQVPTWT